MKYMNAPLMLLAIGCTAKNKNDAVGMQIPKIRCIELCVEISKPADDQLVEGIKKCELQFPAEHCSLVP